jgi:ribonuclease G
MNSQLNRHLIIDKSPGETRVAVLEQGRLANMFIERENRPWLRGATILGKVQAVKKELNAVFIDLGGAIGYLDGIPDPIPVEGEAFLVEVLSESQSIKGPRVTASISLRGALANIYPNQNGYSISRNIKAKGRRALIRDLLLSLIPEDIGVWVKDAAIDCDFKDLRSDLESLLSRWNNLQNQIKPGVHPKILEPSPGPEGVVFDLALGSLVDEGKNGLLFDKFNIDSEIKKALERQIEVKGGVILTFDETEALTAIDIDIASYKTARSHPFELVELLAKEIFWQIRLRKISGIILIDYPRERNKKVRDHFYSEFKKVAISDENRMAIHGWTRTGLLEITRDRLEPTLRDIFHEKNSKTKLLAEVVALSTLRKLTNNMNKITFPQLVCSPELRTILYGPLRRAFDVVNKNLGTKVDVQVDPQMDKESVYIQARQRA